MRTSTWTDACRYGKGLQLAALSVGHDGRHWVALVIGARGSSKRYRPARELKLHRRLCIAVDFASARSRIDRIEALLQELACITRKVACVCDALSSLRGVAAVSGS